MRLVRCAASLALTAVAPYSGTDVEYYLEDPYFVYTVILSGKFSEYHFFLLLFNGLIINMLLRLIFLSFFSPSASSLIEECGQYRKFREHIGSIVLS